MEFLKKIILLLNPFLHSHYMLTVQDRYTGYLSIIKWIFCGYMQLYYQTKLLTCAFSPAPMIHPNLPFLRSDCAGKANFSLTAMFGISAMFISLFLPITCLIMTNNWGFLKKPGRRHFLHSEAYFHCGFMRKKEIFVRNC